MQLLDRRARVLGTLALLGLGAGCADEIPTLSGRQHFPAGALPATVELLVPAADFLTGVDVYGGFANVGDADYRLVARSFDGVLDAHTLARFLVPDSLVYSEGTGTVTDTSPIFRGGRLVGVVNDSASAAGAPVTLRLWALAQSWDSATVSWTHAVDQPGTRVPWTMAGGTRGQLLSEAVWTPGGERGTDTLSWAIGPETVLRMRSAGYPGLLITAETGGSRVELSPLRLEVSLSPVARPDTVHTRTLTSGAQTFIFNPQQPQRPGVIRVGGVAGERTILQLDLSRGVPTCASPAQTPTCPRVPLREVSLNRAMLLLDPLPVPQGFRPLGSTRVSARRVVEPELGARAPLGELVAFDTISAGRFIATGGAAFGLDVTNAVRRLAAEDRLRTSLALFVEPEGSSFGAAWFTTSPRLRLVYTLPQRARLP